VQRSKIGQRYRLAEGNQRKTLEPESEESREEKRERSLQRDQLFRLTLKCFFRYADRTVNV